MTSITPSAEQHNSIYTGKVVLEGHKGIVTCIAVTSNGLVASGGTDGVRLWDLQSEEMLARPTGAGQRGPTTALAWIRREDDPEDGLVYGTANGYLVCWKETRRGEPPGYFEETYCAELARPGEVTGIAFDTGSNRLAVCNRNSVVQVFTIDSRMDLVHIFSVVLKDHVPKTIAFAQTGGEYRDILTFGLYDGLIHTLRGSDGMIQQTRNTGSMIGNAAVNSRRGVFCVDDPFQGIALYRLDSGARVRTCEVKNKKTPRPRQVSFAEDCSVIMSSSDHGIVYMFDRRTGDVVDKLKAGHARIQAVAAGDINEVPYVLAATSQDNGDESDIIVWVKKKGTEAREVTDDVERVKLTDWTKAGFHIGIGLASLVFVSQHADVLHGIGSQAFKFFGLD